MDSCELTQNDSVGGSSDVAFTVSTAATCSNYFYELFEFQQLPAYALVQQSLDRNENV